MKCQALSAEHAVTAQRLSLASVGGLRADEVIGRFPWLRAVSMKWMSHWATPVATLQSVGGRRIWALARAPAELLGAQVDMLYLDATDALFGWDDKHPRKPKLMDLADLSSRLATWSGIRLAYWYQLAQRTQASLRERQGFIQWISPLERRLRDDLILHVWRQSLQGDILPSPAFATGHEMTLPLVRWVLAPRQEAFRLQRRAVIGRAHAAIGLLLGQMTARRPEVFGALKCLARLFRGTQQPSSRAIAQVLAPRLGMPAWAVRRIMQFEITHGKADAETPLVDLQRLSHQLPARAWPRDQASLHSAVRCLRAMDGMLCFGLVDCTAWPEDTPLPPKVLRWMLRELRVCHHGDWSRFARALEVETPRYQLLQHMLARLSNSFQDVHQDDPDAMERISEPWRRSSPAWWLDRLPRWWSKTTARSPRSRGLAWQPLHADSRQFGARTVYCVHSANGVDSLLEQYGQQHLRAWMGLSLVGRVQWLLFSEPGARRPSSLAVLHATTRHGELLVELIAHVPLVGGDEPALPCRDALLQLWAQREADGWGALARVEHEEVLAEDEELFLTTERTRMRVWRSLSSIAGAS